MTRVIVTDQTHAPVLLEWMSSRLQYDNGAFDASDCRTIAHLEQNENGQHAILGVVAFNRWTKFSCDASVATDGTKRCASRDFIFTVYDYAFRHADKSRINLIVHCDNAASIKLQTDLGHTRIAELTDYFGEGKDAILFGLTRKQWMNGSYAKPSPKRET